MISRAMKSHTKERTQCVKSSNTIQLPAWHTLSKIITWAYPKGSPSLKLPFIFVCVQSQIAAWSLKRMRHRCMRTACTWNLQKLSWKVSTDSMISRAMKSHTSEYTVRGRPTLKDDERFRNGWVCKPYERSIYDRTFWVNLSRIMLYQRNHQPGLATLQLDKKHLHKRHRMIVNQLESQLELKNVWATRAKR